MLLSEIFEKVKVVNARAKMKHGPWKGRGRNFQRRAISEEFREWKAAFKLHDVDGPHGEIAEAIDTINVLCRRIQFLTGEDDA